MSHPLDCLCAACLAATLAPSLPWEFSYDPTDALHAELNHDLAPQGVLVRVSSLSPRAWQALCVDPADGTHADDWPTGVGGSPLAALEAFAAALDARAEDNARPRPAVVRLSEAFPRGVTLDAGEVLSLLQQIDQRAAGGA